MDNRDKQIEEMGTIIATKAFERAHEIDGDENLADIVATELYEKGYRKSTDLAEEIFAEIEDTLDRCAKDNGAMIIWALAELKKKYLGKDTNVPTNTEDK